MQKNEEAWIGTAELLQRFPLSQTQISILSPVTLNVLIRSNYDSCFQQLFPPIFLSLEQAKKKKNLIGPKKISKLFFSQLSAVKGQIISKGLFGILGFFQKTNERIRFYYCHEFVRLFFGRIRGRQKVLLKLSDL